MKNNLNVGFVGCGGFTRGNHLPNVQKNPLLKIHALCDLNREQLDTLENTFSPKYVTTDMKDIFSDDDIDMVICGTNPDFRLPVMEMAAEANKPLFVEKPLCYSADEIEPMVKLIKSSKIPFAVGFNRPYSPIMQDLKPIFEKVKGGNTTIIHRIVGEARLWPKHHYENVMINKESTIIHEVTHIFDLINWLTNSMPNSVYTAGGGNTDNVLTLKYPDDITAVIIAGDNSCAGFPKERIEINTNYHTITGNIFTELRHYSENGLEVDKNYEYEIAGEKKIKDFHLCVRERSEWRASLTPEQIEYGYYYDKMPKPDKGHYNEIEHFRQVIIGEKELETDVISGAAANIIAWKAIESWETGKAVELDLSYLNDL
ncbi:MAG: Gfo/Idh/MocA family protein [Planctomycetota bacterium]